MKTRGSQIPLTLDPGRGSSVIELMEGRDFRLDVGGIASRLSVSIPRRMNDLLRIAASVYVCDRIIKRPRRSVPDWQRSLRLKLRVSDLAFWSSPSHALLLAEMLGFLTGDDWNFEFTDGGPSLAPQHTEYWISSSGSAPPYVCLYSGGLDSAAGFVQHLKDVRDSHVIPVMVRHQLGQRRVVEKQFDLLKSRFGATIAPLLVKFAMRRPAALGMKEENTQRSRSFLFCAVGGTVAALGGASCVDMYESGIGAVNLPLMSGMVGAKATKSSHPYFLRSVSSLISAVAGSDIRIQLPYAGMTKAEVVRGLSTDSEMRQLAISTVSCVHYPLHNIGPKQCGRCPACIFRQQAMAAAGIVESDSTYAYGLFADNRGADSIPQSKLLCLKAFLMQISKLSAVEDGQLPPVLARHLIGTGIVGATEPLGCYLDLYRRYRREWVELIADRQANSVAWATLFGPVTIT